MGKARVRGPREHTVKSSQLVQLLQSLEVWIVYVPPDIKREDNVFWIDGIFYASGEYALVGPLLFVDHVNVQI